MRRDQLYGLVWLVLCALICLPLAPAGATARAQPQPPQVANIAAGPERFLPAPRATAARRLEPLPVFPEVQPTAHSWIVAVVDSAGDVGQYSSLALDAADLPHIAYFDNIADNLKYAYRQGSSWVSETVASDGSVGPYASLALDSLDQPHIACLDDSVHDLLYAHLSGTVWLFETVDPDIQGHTSLALDPYDRPCIAYYGVMDNLDYAYRYDGTWTTEPVDILGSVGRYTSLALDAAGRPHISYYDADGQNLKYAYRDGSWTGGAVDIAGNVGLYTSLALDVAGRPHISYYRVDTQDLKYASYDGSDWMSETVDSAGDVGLYTSLALDADGRPHITYYRGDTQDLKYAYFDGSSWVSETVDDAGNVGLYTSLALDAAGRPHISYYDAGNGDLKYAYLCTPVEWVDIEGLPRPPVGETVVYTATYFPLTATLPLTVTWNNSAVGLTAAYSWTLPGPYTIVVTASNPCGEGTGTRVITACLAASGANFVWTPPAPAVNEAVTFTGTATGSLPITFTWDLGGVLATGPVASHVYTASGRFTLTMTATNPCHEVAVTHTLTVLPLFRSVYLPLVIRDWNSCYLGPAGFWEIEDNDYFEQTNGPLCSGTEYYGYPDDSDDYFAFIAGQGTAAIEMWNYAPGDYGQLLLYNEDYQMVGWDAYPSGGWQVITPTLPGTYYIRIYTAGAFTSTEPYTLRATFSEP